MDPDEALNRAQMQWLTQSFSTKADKIRALAREDYTRQQIADFLGIRYQHVRNVLVDDERKARAALGPVPADWPADLETKSAERPPSQPGMREPPAKPPTEIKRTSKVKLGPEGTLTLPPDMLKALGWAEGETIWVHMENDGELRVQDVDALTRRVQARVRNSVPEGVSLVDELREERRLQREREDRLCGE
jgi:antitoxin component of MazEF toxin-antitoxin module